MASLFLEQGERLLPELQVEDAALAGQDVVADADAAHGREMGPHDPPGDVAGHSGRGVLAVLDPLHDLGLAGPGLRMLGEVGRDPGIEVPAVIIELALERFEVGDALLLELQDAVDDVDDLDARVVDVVLDLDVLALESQTAGQRVAQDGVPEVADVGGLVGIDVRVLDDDLRFVGREARRPGGQSPFPEKGLPVEEQVDEPGARRSRPSSRPRAARRGRGPPGRSSGDWP